MNSNSQIGRNSVSIMLGIGKSHLSNDLTKGENAGSVGGNMKLEYQYFINKWVGFKTGITLQSYASEAIMNFSEETLEYDSEGDFRLFKTIFNDWHEEQLLKSYEFPVCLNFRVPFNQKFNMIVSIGAKVSLPISASYKTSGGEMKTSAYYPFWNIELYDLPKYGFDTYSNEFKGTFKTVIGYVGIAEIGCNFILTDQLFLQGKSFYNFSLNNILESDVQNIYSTSGVYNGLYNSRYVKDVKPVAFGFALGLGYNF
jgi:hypothetical protein